MGSTNPSAFVGAGGPAGGALTGTYPSPGLSASAVAGAQNWEWLAPDNNLLAGWGDPASEPGTILIIAGTLYLIKLQIRTAITITNNVFGMTTAGSGASTGSFTGLYSSAGSLLSGSSDIAASITAGGGAFITLPLTTPQAVAAGSFVWAALLVNLATTQPTLTRGSATPGVANGGLTAANFRFAVNGTGLTSLPASITPASNTTTGAFTLWVGTS